MALLNVPPPPPPGLVDGSYDKRRCQWMNSEGLTWHEWIAAANMGRRAPLEEKLARKEWKLGVDPTEYGRRTLMALIGIGKSVPVATTSAFNWAYADGLKDGADWDLSGYDGGAAEAARDAGFDTATINAMGASYCARAWHVEEDGPAWEPAQHDYARGVRDALLERAKRRKGRK